MTISHQVNSQKKKIKYQLTLFERTLTAVFSKAFEKRKLITSFFQSNYHFAICQIFILELYSGGFMFWRNDSLYRIFLARKFEVTP